MAVVIPAGHYPRGKRPYVFWGNYYGDPVPGAVTTAGKAFCAADTAWIFEAAGLRLMRTPSAPPAPVCNIEGLFPYQADGVCWLAGRDYALLADEMGLGKTVQAIRAAEARLRCARGFGLKVLVLCPAVAKRVWAREIEKWSGRTVAILDGLRPDRLPPVDYVIANYDILYGQRRRDSAGKLNAKEGLEGWGPTLAAERFPIVICDESHNLRGEESRRTLAVKAVAKHSTCVWLLSGTPAPNRVRDLWAQWDLASGELCGRFWPFAKAYCGYEKTQYGSTADGASRTDELGKRLSFWCLGRRKSDVGLQLPEKRREVVRVDVPGHEDRPMPLCAEETRANVVAAALRDTSRAKRPAVVKMVREALQAGQKVVVFTYLREQAEAIAKDVLVGEAGIPWGWHTFCVTGDQSPEQRDVAAQAFRESPKACFVATMDSVGVAISLIGADLVIFADLSYDPAKLLQAEARAHRIGMTNRLLVRYVIAEGTIDDAVAETVVDKLDHIAAAMGAMGDGAELVPQLRRGDVPTADQILERLFNKLIGG